jgi:potassium-transporting ATPase KdpC subunit
MKQFAVAMRISAVLLFLMTFLCGIAYPLMVTVFSQIIFSGKSHGSLIKHEGKVIGSTLIGQEFTHPKYFWGRLSATVPPYNAAASGGSNLAPSNPQLLTNANVRMADLQKADPKNKKRIPIDLITASGSGLDPHISVEAAEYQVPRVAHMRHLSEEEVIKLVRENTSGSTFGFLDEAKVNVLALNRALDALPKVETKEKR